MGLLSLGASDSLAPMFSHIVIFWTKPDVEDAGQQLIDGLNHYLPDIPGVISMHVGRCAPSDRPVVDQSYQVALNITFKSKIVQKQDHSKSLQPGRISRTVSPLNNTTSDDTTSNSFYIGAM